MASFQRITGGDEFFGEKMVDLLTHALSILDNLNRSEILLVLGGLFAGVLFMYGFYHIRDNWNTLSEEKLLLRFLKRLQQRYSCLLQKQ